MDIDRTASTGAVPTLGRMASPYLHCGFAQFVGRPVRRGRLGLSAVTLVLVWVCGCTSLRARGPDQGSRAERLQACYSDLESGRFAVIADFEQVPHMELFRLIAPSHRAEAYLSLDTGLPASGQRCLRFTLAGPNDVLVASNDRVTSWFLKRDWRDYDLLLMQLDAPRNGLELDVSIASGTGEQQTSIHTRRLLNKGWNLLRLDLAEIAEHLALDDVSELRWSLPDVHEPVELGLDDVLLTNNTKDLFGDADTDTGEIYLRQRGLRWALGASGRYELGFAGGQIVQWFDLADDPHRLKNRIAGAVLGPSPIVLPGDELNDEVGTTEVSDFSVLGETVIARQRVLEASPIRAVVQGEWWFAPRGQVPPSDAAFQRWTYAMYPSGNVYVHVECTTAHEDWKPQELGLAVSFADRGDLEHHEHPPARLRDPGRLRHVAFAYAAPVDMDAPGLLFVMHDARRAPVLDLFRDEEAGRDILVASGGTIRRPSDGWTALINLWPRENCAATSPADRALDYSYPADRLDVRVGSLVTHDPGDADGDGFNEQLGHYALAPDGPQLRFQLDGREQPMFYPAFVVKESAGREAWVYVDSTILSPAGRDADGNVLFQIPRVVDDTVTVEVYLRGASPAADS